MTFRSGGTRARVPAMDFTSMVDMVFLLIIFFLATSSLAELNRQQMNLPQERGEPEAELVKPGFVVNVMGDGRMITNGREVSLSEVLVQIDGEIAKLGGEAASLDLLVRAERNTPLQFVNVLAEELSSRGVRAWKLGTEIPRTGSMRGRG